VFIDCQFNPFGMDTFNRLNSGAAKGGHLLSLTASHLMAD
jgi:hypothetical protein